MRLLVARDQRAAGSGSALRKSVATNVRVAASAKGLLELSEGDWEAAETTLTRYVRDAEHPVAHYLVAARAADLQGAAQRRDEWLARALEASTERRAPALIMQAEIHLKHKQLQAAMATLEQLEASGEQNARGLLLLLARASSDGRLAAAAGTGAAAAQHARHSARARRRNRRADLSRSPEGRRRRGRSRRNCDAPGRTMPKSLAQPPDVVVAYARAAMACDDHEAAEAALRESIERHWDEATVLTYGELETDEPFERWSAPNAGCPSIPRMPHCC